MKSKNILLISIVLLSLVYSCTGGRQLPFSFVQICDPQLGMGGYSHDTASLRQTVQQINEMECDFVLICGDLVNHAHDSSYEDFLEITGDLTIPCHLAAGNHDVGNTPDDSTLAYYRKLLGRDYYSFEHGSHAFIVVNTQLWKNHIGEESENHGLWFKETLSRAESMKTPVFVIGHHPLFVKSVDEEEVYYNLPLSKRHELLSLFSSNGVVAYLSGHKHETLLNNYRGIELVTGESTSRNFDNRPLGFRLWEVDKDSVRHLFVPLDSHLGGD